MRKVEEIEEEIDKLSHEEFAEIREWILERDWRVWDAQLEADEKAGKLRHLSQKRPLQRVSRDADCDQ